MDSVDFLLLDYVVDTPAKIKHFLSPNVEELFNKPNHFLGRNLLVEKLSFLFSQNYIRLFSFDDRNSELIKSVSNISDEDFVALTVDGGRIWEQEYLPDWGLYIFDEFDLIDEGIIDVNLGSPNQSTLVKFISPMDLELPINEVTNWKANYWKSFDKGFSCSFKIDEGLYGKVSSSKPVWRKQPRVIRGQPPI